MLKACKEDGYVRDGTIMEVLWCCSVVRKCNGGTVEMMVVKTKREIEFENNEGRWREVTEG